jgi:cation-transporting P-type ATPase 13A2
MLALRSDREQFKTVSIPLHPLRDVMLTLSPIGPFLATIAFALLVTLYMVLAPARWLRKLMQLTRMSWDYKLFLIALGVGYLVIAVGYERHFAQRFAKLLGVVKQRVTGKAKDRKQYKVIQEEARV